MNSNNLPKVGAIILLITTGIIALMGEPTAQTPITNIEEIGAIIAYGEDKVSPDELSEWIVADKPGLNIVDTRSPQEFAQFSIPMSTNIPLVSLMTQDGLDMLTKRGITVLVCSDGVNAGKAWVVLRSKGYEAYLLNGGLEGWIDHLNPSEQSEPALAAKINAFKSHVYGGSADISSEAQKTDAPVAPPPPHTKKRKKKVAGGC